jgi:hypothetical protein
MKTGLKPSALHLLVRNIDRRAKEFLLAVNATRATNRQLPPVRAAGTGLLQAWKEWAKVSGRLDGERPDSWRLCADANHGAPAAGQATMEVFVEVFRINNPSYHASMTLDEVQRPVLLATAAAHSLARPHAVVEPTAASQTWLTLIRADRLADTSPADH